MTKNNIHIKWCIISDFPKPDAMCMSYTWCFLNITSVTVVVIYILCTLMTHNLRNIKVGGLGHKPQRNVRTSEWRMWATSQEANYEIEETELKIIQICLFGVPLNLRGLTSSELWPASMYKTTFRHMKYTFMTAHWNNSNYTTKSVCLNASLNYIFSRSDTI